MIKDDVITRLITAVVGVILLVTPLQTGVDYPSVSAFTCPSHHISVYDRLFQRVAYDAGMDWYLLSAIAYMESRYNPMMRSKRGAVGLMQITPITAKHFNVPSELLEDPALNVMLSVILLRDIEESFDFSGSSEEDRIKIILAGYNCGKTNLKNARIEAAEKGVNHNRWDELKMFGNLNNSETRKFVSDVMHKWREYKLRTEVLREELSDSVSAD